MGGQADTRIGSDRFYFGAENETGIVCQHPVQNGIVIVNRRRAGGCGGTYPRIVHTSGLDQNDPLHELDGSHSDACGGVLSEHHFQYPAFRPIQHVPLLPVISI